MRTPTLSAAFAAFSIALVLGGGFVACGGSDDPGIDPDAVACNDGIDNDGDGLVDFPDDPGCIAPTDTSEDSLPSPKCNDGRDNDGDGFVDFPFDPGCSVPNADDEADDCPDGPFCPQCSDKMDNDGNGLVDFPQDDGCTSASDDDERQVNPVACGPTMQIRQFTTDGVATVTLDTTSISNISSPCGGGGGSSGVAFELYLSENKVVELSTDSSETNFDTIIDVRSADCDSPDSHVACNNNISTTNESSRLTTSLRAGTYYVIVSGYNSTDYGTFNLVMKQFAGEGSACTQQGECGEGLFCRIPLGGTTTSCEKPECSDGVDTDQKGDGDDYPDDPGCSSPEDNDESDTCDMGPGAGCPECGDGIDNDMDGQTDYGMDTTCAAAGDASESCVSTDGVGTITMPVTTGTTVGANNDFTPPLACRSTTHTAPDKVYRIDLPATSRLVIDPDSGVGSLNLLGSSCAGEPVQCKTFGSAIELTNHPAGEYYLVADGYSTTSAAYTITVSGTIANGASCESALAQSGALVCGTGHSCKGTVGSRTCQPGRCGDGIDNDMDGRIDFPFDPGCESLADDTEEDPATPPVCFNTLDDDTDGTIDFPADMGCASAAGTTEAFCTGEADPASKITANPTTGTTVGLANNFTTSQIVCPTTIKTTNGPDKAFGLFVPVLLDTLTIDLNSSTSFDTIVTLRDTTCGTTLACDDDGADLGLTSKLIVPNVFPGNYAVIVDGYSSGSGAYNMVVTGVAANGQKCTDPGFSGADPLFKCRTACTAGVCN